MKITKILISTSTFLIFLLLAVNNADAQLLTCGGSATESDCVTAGGQVKTVNNCTLCEIPKGTYSSATDACSAVNMVPYSSWTYYSGSNCPSDCSIVAGWYNYQPSCTYIPSVPAYFDTLSLGGTCSASGCTGDECYSKCPSSAVYYGDGKTYPFAFCYTYADGNFWWIQEKFGNICSTCYAIGCYYNLGYPTISCSGIIGSYGCVGKAPNSVPMAVIDSPLIASQTINVGGSVNFVGHGTDSDGSIAGYSWRLGSCEGTVLSASQFFKYTFSVAGTYKIYFVAIDDDGASSTNCPYRTITVLSPSPAICIECNNANKANVCIGSNFQSCTGSCSGTKECVSNWQEVLP